MNYGTNRPDGPDMNANDPGRRRGGRGRFGRRDEAAAGDPGPADPGERRGRGEGRRRGEGFGPGRGFGPHALGGAGLPPFGPGFGFGGPGMGHGRGPGGRGRARRGDVRLAILALLAEQSLNGYQIIQALDERTSGMWKPSPGAVYPALNQLEDEGLVKAIEAEGQRVFALTESGTTAAEAVDPKPWDVVNERFGPRDSEGAASVWKEFGELSSAARALALSGDPAQLKAGVDLLQQTKRKLFGILAEEPSGE